MKKILLLMLVAAFTYSARATHLMGGDITVKQDSGSSYTLTLSLYRDTSGIPLGTSEIVEMYTYNSTTGGYYLTSTMTIPRNTALGTTLLPNFPYGVEVGVYTVAGLSLSPGKYRFIYNTCCRNGAILNASNPLSESMVLHTDFEAQAANSSPLCLAMPVAYFGVNTPANYNPLPNDPDGDSLSWSLNIPVGNMTQVSGTPPVFTDVVGFTAPPAAAGGAFTMNSVTGEITWTPNTLGNFIQSFKIDEYRNGIQIGTIIRDMQYVVIPADTTNPPLFMTISPYMTNTVENYNYIYYTPGQPLTFQIEGIQNASGGSALQMESYSSLYQLTANPASFTVSNAVNSVTGTMQWTPSASYSNDVLTIFRLRKGAFTKDFTLLMRKNPNPNAVTTVQNGISRMDVYPNPSNGVINIGIDLSKELNGGIYVYNSLGQMVSTLYSGKLAKGTYTLQNSLSLPAGVYQVVVKDAGAAVKTQHLVIR